MDEQIEALVQRVLEEFRQRCDNDRALQAMREKAEAGNVTYAEAMAYASRVSELSAAACDDVMLRAWPLWSAAAADSLRRFAPPPSEREAGGRPMTAPTDSLRHASRDTSLGEGGMRAAGDRPYGEGGMRGGATGIWREAFRALAPEALDRNYALVAQYCGLTQEALNKKAGLSLKAVTPAHDRDRAEGITKHVSSAKDPEQAAARLATDVESYDRHIVDESVLENAEFHYRSGLRVTVTRIAAPGCCKWCTELAGKYHFEDIESAERVIGMRHANCGCRLEPDFDGGSGRAEVNNYVSGRRERLHADAEAKRRDERKAIPSGHADAAPEKIAERMAIPGGHPDVRPGGVTVDNSGNGGIIKSVSVADILAADSDKTLSRDCVEEIARALQVHNGNYDSVRVVHIPREAIGLPVFQTHITSRGGWCDTSLLINTAFFGENTLAVVNEVLEKGSSKGYAVMRNLEEAIIHECTHNRLAKERNFPQYEALGEVLEDYHIEGISKTAKLNGEECLCETAILLHRGEEVPEVARMLWEEYFGRIE